MNPVLLEMLKGFYTRMQQWCAEKAEQNPDAKAHYQNRIELYQQVLNRLQS